MRATRPLLRRSPFVLAAAISLCSIGRVAAEGDPPPAPERAVAERIRSTRLAFARTAVRVGPVAGRADPRAQDVAERARAGIAAIRERRAVRSGERRARGAQALETRTTGADGAAIEVRRAPGSATPRQVKGERMARASNAGASRLERDTSTARSFLRAQRRTLKLRDPDAELRLERADVDGLGCCQLRFAQTYRGLDVWPSGLVVQVRDGGDVDLVSGAFVPTPRRLETRPSVRAATAVAPARAAVPGGTAAAVSAPRLVVHAASGSLPRLAWSAEVTVSDASRWLVMIDAQTGGVLESFNEVAREDVAGSGIDLLGASRPLHVWHEGATFFMADTSKPMFDATSNPPSPVDMRGGIAVIDAKHTGPDSNLTTSFVTSANPASWALPDAVSASFALSQTYDYYLQRHARDSLDGQGGTMLAIVRVGTNFANAFWSGQFMAFGDAEPYAASLDVVGHELTHGVTDKTAGLVYRSQSGALNESMSDIFGEMVESRTTGGQHDWKVGTKLSAPLRDMRNPSSIEIQPGLPYPSRMSQFIDTSADNGGVHLNSSIINRAYYLLAEGLPNAVGTAAAERIFYRTLTTKLVKESRFIDCRLGAIASAEELFGAGSAQALATAAAFDAVEIRDSNPTPEPLPAPAVSGADSTLFVFFDLQQSATFLGRREVGLGDPGQGAPFTASSVAESRPSVSGDGSLAAYVDSNDDLCLADTEGAQAPQCIGVPGTVHSVAMSPDASKFAFVLEDANGDPLSSITVVDLTNQTQRTIPLTAPLLDGGTIDVLEADSMAFTRDGGMLVYDAFNRVSLADGTELGLWSIYGLDLATSTVFTLVEPTPGLDIGNPSLSHTVDRFVAFDAYDPVANTTTVLALDAITGDIGAIATVANPLVLSTPCYTGDDSAIVFTAPDTTTTGTSLLTRGVAADHVSASGAISKWLDDGAFGVVYRRGELPPLPPPQDVEVTLDTGTPRIETVALDVPVTIGAVPVRLALAHTVTGGFTAGGECTVGGVPVTVTGSLARRKSTASFTYVLQLRSSDRTVRATIRGDLDAGTASATLSVPAGKANRKGLAVAATGFFPTSRIRLRPQVDFRGRVTGTGTILGGFGNDADTVGVLTGKRTGSTLKLVLKDAARKRSLTFKGSLGGAGYVGKLTHKIPPAGGTVTGFVLPDIFGP